MIDLTPLRLSLMISSKPGLMIKLRTGLVQWIRFFIWHAPCPVGSKNLDLSAHTHLCGLPKKRKPMEVMDDCFVSFFWGILPMTQQVSRTVKKKKQLEEKTKKLKFNLKLMSTTLCHELSSVHSTELNSWQPALYSYSTHSNHVRSWCPRVQMNKSGVHVTDGQCQ